MQSNNTFGEPPQAQTQRAKILALLLSACDVWVPLPDIMACAAQYNARILELRRRGFNIENRTERVAGARHSWFRLIAAPTASASKPEPTKLYAPETLFDLSRDAL